MLTVAHIINPFISKAHATDMELAQQVTFETMKTARDYASGEVGVALFAAHFPEDRAIVPDFFELTEPLDRSVLDFGQFSETRKMPLLRDILSRLYEATNAEYLVYTNVDIALMPTFYVAIDRLIQQRYDAFTVTRRTLTENFTHIDQIPLMYAQVGDPHPGTDCFVFKRKLFPNFFLADVCVGAFYFAKSFLLNLICNSKNYKEFSDFHLTFHLGDERLWSNSTFADYNMHNRAEIKKIMAHYEAIDLVSDRIGLYQELVTHMGSRKPLPWA